MLQSAYSEPPTWTLTRLVRSAVITLVSGIIAGRRQSRLLLMIHSCEGLNSGARAHGCHAHLPHGHGTPGRISLAWHVDDACKAYQPRDTLYAATRKQYLLRSSGPRKVLLPSGGSLKHASQRVICLQACWGLAEA